MKEVVRWYVSGFYKTPKGVKKPYNPILGEKFRCYFKNEETNSRTFYIAEQVSMGWAGRASKYGEGMAVFYVFIDLIHFCQRTEWLRSNSGHSLHSRIPVFKCYIILPK